MRVLDLFCGLKGWSGPMRERGHNIVTLDNNPRFNPDICADIMKVEVDEIEARNHFQPYDLIVISPPCEKFSVASIGKYWNHDHSPKTEEAAQALLMLNQTIALVQILQPKYFLIENPRGKMRRMPIMQQFTRWTVTYCQYGESMMKPTDLWGKMPPTFHPKPICKNGDPCHDRAPRGAKTGLQGIPSNDPLRSKIPQELSIAVCKAVEDAL